MILLREKNLQILTIKISIGLSGLRTIGPLDYQADTVMSRFIFSTTQPAMKLTNLEVLDASTHWELFSGWSEINEGLPGTTTFDMSRG
jgi:hypothetical protein